MTPEELFKEIVKVKHRAMKVSATHDSISHLQGYAVVTGEVVDRSAAHPGTINSEPFATRLYRYVESKSHHVGGSHVIFDLSELSEDKVGYVVLNQKRFAADQGIVISTCAFGLVTNCEHLEKIKAEIASIELRLHDLRNDYMKAEAYIGELAEFLKSQRVDPILVNAIVTGSGDGGKDNSSLHRYGRPAVRCD